MKIKMIGLTVLMVLPSLGFAKTLVTCDGGEELQVAIRELSGKNVRADVTVQSFGDSYPTFHYNAKDEGQEAGYRKFIGNKFSLSIDDRGEGRLVVKDLDLNERVECKVR